MLGDEGLPQLLHVTGRLQRCSASGRTSDALKGDSRAQGKRQRRPSPNPMRVRSRRRATHGPKLSSWGWGAPCLGRWRDKGGGRKGETDGVTTTPPDPTIQPSGVSLLYTASSACHAPPGLQLTGASRPGRPAPSKQDYRELTGASQHPAKAPPRAVNKNNTAPPGPPAPAYIIDLTASSLPSPRGKGNPNPNTTTNKKDKEEGGQDNSPARPAYFCLPQAQVQLPPPPHEPYLRARIAADMCQATGRVLVKKVQGGGRRA